MRRVTPPYADIRWNDFEVSARLDSSHSAKTVNRIALPYWIALEVVLSKGNDTKANVLSFGITTVGPLTGRPPGYEIPGAAFLIKIQTVHPP
jgi:hypothetical protein